MSSSVIFSNRFKSSRLEVNGLIRVTRFCDSIHHAKSTAQANGHLIYIQLSLQRYEDIVNVKGYLFFESGAGKNEPGFGVKPGCYSKRYSGQGALLVLILRFPLFFKGPWAFLGVFA